MPQRSSCVDMGGYTFSSEPVTSWPAALSMPANDPIPVPATPMRWMRRMRSQSVTERSVYRIPAAGATTPRAAAPLVAEPPQVQNRRHDEGCEPRDQGQRAPRAAQVRPRGGWGARAAGDPRAPARGRRAGAEGLDPADLLVPARPLPPARRRDRERDVAARPE